MKFLYQNKKDGQGNLYIFVERSILHRRVSSHFLTSGFSISFFFVVSDTSLCDVMQTHIQYEWSGCIRAFSHTGWEHDSCAVNYGTLQSSHTVSAAAEYNKWTYLVCQSCLDFLPQSPSFLGDTAVPHSFWLAYLVCLICSSIFCFNLTLCETYKFSFLSFLCMSLKIQLISSFLSVLHLGHLQ